MDDYIINQSIYSVTLDLINNYSNLNVQAEDYLKLNEEKLPSKQKDDYEPVFALFISITKHWHFLKDVTNYFYCLAKRRDFSDRSTLIVLSHIIMCILNENNKNDILDILYKEKLQKVITLLTFFNRKTIVEDLFTSACSYFEEEYVMENIILNVQNNNNLLKEMLLYFKESLSKKEAESQREVTKCVSPHLSTSTFVPPPPCNTPEIQKVPSPRPVPKSTYKKPEIANVLAEIKEKNKRSSLKLLEESNNMFGNITYSTKTVQHSCFNDTEHYLKQSKPKKLQKFSTNKNVKVKKTASTILREAARIIKDEEIEIKRINELLTGANYIKYEEYLEEVRVLEEESRLQDIERKHLQGLLTREEAIIARQNLLEINKAKRAQYDLEKSEIEAILKKLKKENDEKIKKRIQETQDIQSNIKEKKKEVLDKNHRNAQQLSEYTRTIYEEALLKQKAELDQRIKLIREIKTLSRIKDLHSNRFDPTETMNLGFLCEMSLSELQERVIINKIQINEEIERRKNCLRKQKLEHQQFLTCTEQFIEESRKQKKELKTISKEQKCNKNTLQSKEIKDLQEKLNKAKQKRIEGQKKK